MEVFTSCTRAAGLARLHAFVPEASAAYARGRNYDRGDGAACTVSCLSPYVQRRLLSEVEIITAVLQQHAPAAAEKFLQEVLWRTYWKGWLEMHPQIWTAWRAELRAATELPRALRDALARAEAGATGIACFDDWAQTLRRTGLLHNHVRMWFASIWIFTLKLPWALGAAFFYRHLLDADAASNTLSWRWVAGLQTRGKIYLAQSANIARYTEGRYPTTPQLAQQGVPPVDAVAVQAEPLALPELPAEFPAGRLGLLLHPDDLSLECGELRDHRFAALAALGPSWRQGALAPAAPAAAVSEAAMADACARASARYGVSVERLEAGSAEASPAACAGAVAAWIRQQRLQGLVLVRPFVGPWRDAMAELLAASAAQRGCALYSFRREHDRAWFPHASRGFFQLKKRMPQALATLAEGLAEAGPGPRAGSAR